MKTAKSLLYFNLVKLLDKCKISNSEIAEVLGISQGTLSQKMGGITDWKLTEMLKVQEYLLKATRETYGLDYLFEKERE